MPSYRDLDRGAWPHTEDGRLVVTQSMVTTFAKCPRETYYGIVKGLRPRVPAKPLTRGTWVHALLEARANGDDWQEVHRGIIAKHAGEMFDEDLDTLASECYDILQSYEYHYRHDQLTPVATELTVERPLLRDSVLYRGRIDVIWRDRAGDVWLGDHKTHRVLPDWRYRELAFQHYSYLWAVAKSPSYLALGLPQPRGFIYDYCRTAAIRRPTLLKSGRVSRTISPTQTTYPVFRDWLIEHGLLSTVAGRDLVAIEEDDERSWVEDMLRQLQLQSVADAQTFFRRDIAQFSRSQRVRQHKAFLATVRRLITYRWDDPDLVERNLEACSGFTCAFKDLTTEDLVHGDSSIGQATRYVTTSDPLDYYPKQEPVT